MFDLFEFNLKSRALTFCCFEFSDLSRLLLSWNQHRIDESKSKAKEFTRSNDVY